MTTTQKFRNFVQEPMGNKEVTQLAGIGNVLGEKLQRIGFNKASKALGQFLIFDKNEELYKDWLKEAIHANEKQAGDCCRCLKEWCDNYL